MKYFLIETEKKNHVSFGNSKRNLRIAGYKHTYLIGGIAFDESILRRGVCGIKLTEVEVE